MEVLMGPTFSIEVSSSPASVAAALVVPNSSPEKPCFFLKEDEVAGSGNGSLISIGPEDSSDSSSSIGAPDDSDEEEGEEVQSGGGISKGAFGSFDSLEESLPIKRGLSNHFTGKSKSFANLLDMSGVISTVKELEKPENPFNKRRRLLMANKWCRKSKSAFYNWPNPTSMPLLTLNEEQDDHIHEQEQEQDDEEEEASPSSSSEQDVLKNHPKLSRFQDKKFRTSFRSHSCFSLSDMQDQQFQ